MDTLPLGNAALIDTMASWALDGLKPTPAITHDISEFVNGKLTTQQLITKAKGGGYGG